MICIVCAILENSLSFMLTISCYGFKYFQFEKEEAGVTAQDPPEFISHMIIRALMFKYYFLTLNDFRIGMLFVLMF